MHDVKSALRAFFSLFTGMPAAFALVALLVAAAGVYGLVAFSVGQRTREIGLRVALGATPSAILSTVAARGGAPVAIRLALGVAGAGALASVTSSILPEIELQDPLAYLVVGVPLMAVAFVAT